MIYSMGEKWRFGGIYSSPPSGSARRGIFRNGHEGVGVLNLYIVCPQPKCPEGLSDLPVLVVFRMMIMIPPMKKRCYTDNALLIGSACFRMSEDMCGCVQHCVVFMF